MDLKGKTIIVTGASQGIGSTLAQTLGGHGANVACAARSAAGLQSTVAAVGRAGGRALAVPTDVSDQSAVQHLIDETVARFGGIDALVNNAALVGNTTDLTTDIASFKRELDVNLYGALHGILAALPHLKARNGTILNVSSSIALNLMPGMFAYGVTKIALERLTLDVAEQLKPFHVSCNALRIDVGVMPDDWSPDRHDIDPEATKQIIALKPFFEPLQTGADAMVWMLRQGGDYTGQLESLREMIVRKSITGRAEKLMPKFENMRWSW